MTIELKRSRFIGEDQEQPILTPRQERNLCHIILAALESREIISKFHSAH
jgi:hypothetical protein